MKRMSCLILAIALLLAAFPAQAGAECCRRGCSRCRSDRDCFSCFYCRSCLQTAKPRTADLPPLGQPCAQRTQAPSYRSTPALRPTARPTIRPTAAVVSRPSARPTAAATSAPSIGTGDYTTLSSAAQEQILLNLLNQDRAAYGLPALELDEELSRLARLKSCDMRDQRYFAHESPTYGNAAAMLTAFGYPYSGVGENIAHHATVEKAEAAFLSSTGHRTNIMGKQWKKVGLGVCFDSSGFVYVTQLFVR